jgi:UDP-glucuronate decarboxylase
MMELRKSVLVTGGAGFVGSHLVDRLMQSGCRVTALDNLHTGCKENVSRWLGHPDFALVVADVRDFEPTVMFHEIYHLASPASPPVFIADPLYTISTIVIGTFRMLDIALRQNAKILIASTSEVYGDPLEHPQSESYLGNVNPIGPRACYEESKRLTETMAMAYLKEHGLQISIARIFNTYGPRMKEADGRVISNFIVGAINGTDLEIYGDGLQTRSFQYISDLIDGLVLLMQSGVTAPVNLGNPEEFLILDVAKKIIASTNSTSKIVHKQKFEDDPRKRKPDISLSKAELQWSPQIEFEEGLRLTIDYFRKKTKDSPNSLLSRLGQVVQVNGSASEEEHCCQNQSKK